MEQPERQQEERFPEGFLWGVSTSAYQVEEGDPDSQWVAWEKAGRIRSGHTRDRACEWWANAEQDFDLAKGLGLNSLRLSVDWSRIEPRPGVWQDDAVQRYRAMLRGLRDRGLRPFVTLHHFTHPAWFEERGGFLAPDSPGLFAQFASRVVNELGDLCSDWVTINEPNVFCTLGYQLGDFPPGHKGQFRPAILALANMARGHARAYRAIHRVQKEARVGWAQNYLVFAPANRRSFLDRMLCRLLDEIFNRSFFRIISDGDGGITLRAFTGDVSEARGTADFVGLNVYNRVHVAFDLRYREFLFANLFVPEDVPQGDQGTDWPYGEAYPEGIALAVKEASRLGKPVYILENGVPDASDRLRPSFLIAALRRVQQLTAQGFPVAGYFHWTLTDNFEWSEGWRLRFGLYALDVERQLRRMRPSAELYKAVVRSNSVPVELKAKYLWMAPP
jgi:beta-glucosidase